MFPTDSNIEYLFPQQVALFGDAVQLSGSVTSLEEVDSWRWALSFRACPYFQPSLCFVVPGNVD